VDIKHMSLEQKIGQILMVGFPSDKYDDHIKELVEEYKIGNFILFSRNIKDKFQLADLNYEIQRNVIKHVGIPAFIGIDQEGGMVTRIHESTTFLPGNMAIAATGDPNNACRIGEISGKELRALGININFAPVLDVNSNPENPVIGVRSYSDNPEMVADFGIKYIEGLQKENVIATAKHFPGHGDTSVDSHLDLPVITHEKERLETTELKPFKKAIENGVDAIMSAHILFTAYENEKLPATLSYKILTELLRERMGFKGIILTDCMEMNAISKYFGTAKAAVMAIKAGADIVLISHTKELQIEAFNKIKAAVISGEISELRIDESVRRIIDIKKKYNILDDPYPNYKLVNEIVGCAYHRKVAEEISRNSLTLVKDEMNLIPIRTKNILAISPESTIFSKIADKLTSNLSFAEAVVNKFGGDSMKIPVNPDESIINSILEKIEKYDLIIVGTYNANLNGGQVKLVNNILNKTKNVIVVALMNPYDILKFKDVSTYLCAYEYTQLSVNNIIECLNGKFNSSGDTSSVIVKRGFK